MKKYKVFLFRDKNCVRGWLAYVDTNVLSSASKPDRIIEIEGKNASDAKNKAITLANKKHLNYPSIYPMGISGYHCPKCGDEIEPDDPKGDGKTIIYYCETCLKIKE